MNLGTGTRYMCEASLAKSMYSGVINFAGKTWFPPFSLACVHVYE